MKVCPNCHEEYTTDIEFCSNCNQSLVPKEMKICPRCSKKYPSDDSNCPHCGYNLNSENQNPELILPCFQYMGFIDAIKVCLKKYVTTKGRATRTEFWFFVLFFYLAMLGGVIFGGLLLSFLLNESAVFLAMMVAVLLLLPPLMSVYVRRLHDTGHSGLWLLSYFILYVLLAGLRPSYFECIIAVLTIPLFIFSLMNSNNFDNKYGPYVVNYISRPKEPTNKR